MKRTKVALIIAGAGTLSVVLGVILMLCEKSLQLSHMADIVTLFVLLGMAAGIVSFFFVGIGGVFKFVWNIAKWGFVAVPFPICLLAVPVTFFIGLYVLLFVPILPVFSVHRKKMAGLA